jgi:prevent-host-death family protein
VARGNGVAHRPSPGTTLTHMDRAVDVRELGESLSRYLALVKEGQSLRITDRGREIARLTPPGPADSPLARLAAERGATVPRGDLLVLDAPGGRPADGPPSARVCEDLRAERL